MTLKKHLLQLEAKATHERSCVTNHLLGLVRHKNASERVEKLTELRQKMIGAGVIAAVVNEIIREVERALAE